MIRRVARTARVVHTAQGMTKILLFSAALLMGCAASTERPEPTGGWLRDYVCIEELGSEWCPADPMDGCCLDDGCLWIYDESVTEYLDLCR